ncbi:DUF4844 domain-containing protein [Pontibacter diazotrophicus]|uniref:DUF4844 domain-containing protein n=1 Tax=Pontibacter diazotrophicus TaxID=1400979 RepID=UPI0015F17866|nr:DUF4844 domain-containing protein [Pontibacter diazotrophicus]
MSIETISSLKALLKKYKFSNEEWEKRGLNPSSTELSIYLDSALNSCLESLIHVIEKSSSEKSIKRALKAGIQSIDKSALDTEEKEFVADYFYQISQTVGVDFKNELNSWLYGSFLTTLMKLKEMVNPERIVETLSQDCTKCETPLETFILKKEEGIPDYEWEIVQCNNCGEYNLLEKGPNIKMSRKGNYEYVEHIRKDEFTFEQAKTRLEQIRYFRKK